jgi:hypothetical protein
MLSIFLVPAFGYIAIVKWCAEKIWMKRVLKKTIEAMINRACKKKHIFSKILEMHMHML